VLEVLRGASVACQVVVVCLYNIQKWVNGKSNSLLVWSPWPGQSANQRLMAGGTSLYLPAEEGFQSKAVTMSPRSTWAQKPFLAPLQGEYGGRLLGRPPRGQTTRTRPFASRALSSPHFFGHDPKSHLM